MGWCGSKVEEFLRQAGWQEPEVVAAPPGKPGWLVRGKAGIDGESMVLTFDDGDALNQKFWRPQRAGGATRQIFGGGGQGEGVDG